MCRIGAPHRRRSDLTGSTAAFRMRVAWSSAAKYNQTDFFMKTKLLLAACLCVLPLRSAPAQTLDEIVKKIIDARGGVEKIKAVQSERITGRVLFAQGFEGTLVLELKR